MSQKYYVDLPSADAVKILVAQVCSVDNDSVVSVSNVEQLVNELIYTLQFNATTSEDLEVKQAAMYWINEIARALDVRPSSNCDFYDQKAQGEHQFFTVPAINSRMMTFHTVRAAVRAAETLGLPHIIFELALSEVGYTAQQKDEYVALVKAAYISLGLSNREIYLQADHYQLDPKKYAADSTKEVQRLKDAITKAIENEVYNIDIDASKFETADPTKTDRENQSENAHLTAELFHFIREYERAHSLPYTVSIGGEVGEVGGENTKFPQVNAYLELLHEHARELGSGGAKGLSKVSINVGSAHGGFRGPDGKPLESVPLDFTAHHDVFMKGVDPTNSGKHVLSVQHGASTLPKQYFALFPAMHVAEIHLATGFQDVVWDIIEANDKDLFQKMKNLVLEKYGDKVASYETEAVGLVKERKNITQYVKRDLLLSPAVPRIEEALEREFSTIFNSLYRVLQPKAGQVDAGDRAD